MNYSVALAASLFLVSAATADAAGDTLEEILQDNRTYVYNDRTVRPVIQDDFGLLYPKNQRFNSRSYNGASVNPNAQSQPKTKWSTDGGLKNVSHTAKRVLYVPLGKWVELQTRQATFNRARKTIIRTYGTYPNGTIAGVFLYHRGRLFEIRSLKKEDGKWGEDERIFLGSKPPGYEEIENCTQCHEDIGKHHQSWVATIRGMEMGGPIAAHFFDWREVYRRPGQRPVIRDDVKKFVRWKSD